MPHKEIVEDLTGDCTPGYCLLREVLTHMNGPVPLHDTRYGHCETGDCPLKERVIQSGLSDKTLEQIKCIDLLKQHENMESRNFINWNEAYKIWTRKGHAKAFSDIYQEGMKHRELYSKVIYRNPIIQ
jgi:hypothetical protein